MPDRMELRRLAVVSISGGDFSRPGKPRIEKKKNAQPTSFVQYLESNATKRDTVLANQVGRMFRPTLQVGK